MSYIPTAAEAEELVKRYNKDHFHIVHAETVSGVMGYWAREFDPENEEYWKAVGMIHDIDFEMYPEEHCKKGVEIMRELDIDETMIHAMASHGYGICSDVEPERYMEKVLFTIDELTGIIGACVMVRPSKSTKDLEVKSVMKKYKQPSFAAGCSREVIDRGCAMLGLDIKDVVERTILAMRELEG